MGSILGFFLSFVLLYKYVAIFVIAFAAGIILPLPVSALLLAVGAFSGQGYFNFTAALLAAGGGNVMGDLVDYFLARKYGMTVVHRFKADRSKYFVQLEKYLRQHAGLTIFLTRFAASLDPVVNFLSGLAGVSFSKFLFYDAVGNFLEIFVILSVGYIVGTQWQSLSGTVNIIGAILIISILIVVLISVYRRVFRGNLK